MTSRTKLHASNSGGTSGQVCADCSSPDPGWGSLNRGVVLCSECCAIHRSLGRHVSLIRRYAKPPPGVKIQQQFWGAQRALLSALSESGANNIWEHLLMEPVSAAKFKRKPNPRDPLHPTKAEFIQMKYGKLAFCLKNKENENCGEHLMDLNRQLAACVRTCHVETTLRLLIVGADPNYIDLDKGCLSPMHVASKEGQALQIELLVIYGGDVAQPDSQGKTSVDYAKEEGHKDLVERITQILYQVTDRLSHYLCDRLPDHNNNVHFIIPEVASAGINPDDNKKINARSHNARRRIGALSTVAFEQMLQDVHDEVDRREIDNTWTTVLHKSEPNLATQKYLLPFLPLTADLSATRNQTRQKLAKLNARDLAAVVIDLLTDAKRRERLSSDDVTPQDESIHGISSPQSPQPNNRVCQSVSSDIPEYDSVASRSYPTSPMVEQPGNRSRLEHESVGKMSCPEEYNELRDQLLQAETKVDDLISGHKEIMGQIKCLTVAVERLTQENAELRVNLTKSNRNSTWSRRGGSADFEVTNPWMMVDNAVNGNTDRNKLSPMQVNKSVLKNGHERQLVGLRNVTNMSNSLGPPSPKPPAIINGDTSWRGAGLQTSSSATQVQSPSIHEFPQNLVHETENLTNEIQRLLFDAQSGHCFAFVSHAGRIQQVVDKMVAMIPTNSTALENIAGRMVDACISLTVICSREANSKHHQEQISCHIVQAAFEVAKAAKLIMEDIQR